jgi:hypothetical protein
VEESLNGLTRVAITHFLTERLAESGKRMVGDKTPFLTTETLKEMSVILPQARVIHIIRDGRDIAVSHAHHRWNQAKDEGGAIELEPEEAAKRDAYRRDPEGFRAMGESILTKTVLRSTAKSWRDHVLTAVEEGPALLGPNYAEVRYEDLLDRPKDEVGRLLRFLGADAAEGVVEECVDRASFESWTKGRERGREDSKAFLRKGVAGDWKNVFTERDKSIFKEVAGDLLIRLGYERDDGW